jgi:uncharacterized protein (UPF0548 family)
MDSVAGTEGLRDEYRVDVPIPKGADANATFATLTRRLLKYDVFPPWLMDACVCTNDGIVTEGATIVQRITVGLFTLEAAVRVSSRWERAQAQGREVGFTYATVAGHPERGTSTFALAHDALTGVISFRVSVRSRPGSVLAKLTRPIARRFQRRATQAALRYFATLR